MTTLSAKADSFSGDGPLAVRARRPRPGLESAREDDFRIVGAKARQEMRPGRHVAEKPIVHLSKPRGGSLCGAPAEADEMTPDINFASCPECIRIHGRIAEDAESGRATASCYHRAARAIDAGLRSDTCVWQVDDRGGAGFATDQASASVE